MITFKQFLSEGDSDEFSKFMREKCHEFLDQSSGEFLYRGMKNMHVDPSMLESSDGKKIPCYLLKARGDRAPADTPGLVHKAADDWFKERFGWGARSASVFCTGDPKIGMTYGKQNPSNLYMIFPVGEFKFIWSPKVADMFGYFDSRTKGGIFDITETEYVNDVLDAAEYRKTNLSAAIQSSNEIMIGCNEYIAIPFSFEDEVKKELKS